jgi:photosystem II stability/assembly factor-like uncharacterized protein
MKNLYEMRMLLTAIFVNIARLPFGSGVFFLYFSAAVLSLSTFPGVVSAHHPHDVIDLLAVSPAYDRDQSVFIGFPDGKVLRSTDGGYSWKQLARGLDNRTPLTALAVSPFFGSDGTVFLATGGDGIYRSQDRGNSWSKANAGLPDRTIGLLIISPAYHLDATLLAADGSGGLYKSKDRGESWYPVMTSEAIVTAAAFSPVKGGSVIIGDANGMLYLSADGGEAWRRIAQLPEGNRATAIAIAMDGTVFAGTEKGGIYRSTEDGTFFAAVNEGLSDRAVRSLALSPGYDTDKTVYASTWYEGVFRSTNGGNHWISLKQGLTTDRQADSVRYKSPHFRQLGITRTFAQDRTLFLAGFDGLFKTMDSGKSWKQMETMPPSLIMALALPSDPQSDSSVAVLTAMGGVYLSENQGRSWKVKNTGLSCFKYAINLAFSPSYHKDETIFLLAEKDLAHSNDRGNSWQIAMFAKKEGRFQRLIRSGLHKLHMPVPRILKPKLPNPDVVAISPNFANDHLLYFGTRRHGIFQSINGGISWFPISEEMRVSSLILSPDFTRDETLFAGVRGQGIYRSVNSGESWQPVNNGLESLSGISASSIVSSAVDITRQDVKLTISPEYREDRTVFAGSAAGLYRTADGGERWQKITVVDKDQGEFIKAMAISPNFRKDRTVLVSVKGKGLYKSIDGGSTFIKYGSGLILNNYVFKQIEFSPLYAENQMIYGVSDEEVFNTTDGGQSWTLLFRPVRYEDSRRDVIQYDGQWRVASGGNFSASSASYSEIPQTSASLNFVGTGVTLIGSTSNDQGIAKIYIDGRFKSEIDQFSPTPKTLVNCFSIKGIERASHIVTIEATGRQNPESKGSRVVIDAFDVIRHAEPPAEAIRIKNEPSI